ncbi:MAG TPA: ABC transporter ATP-binding protein [Sphingobacterium sp.]|nr:ABC transporter ATP-binding protein [Sphingobacterium sp.]
MLKAGNIYKSYGNLEILKGVDLQVKEGEIVSIIGSSGAGKSTLLHILGTLDKPDKGRVWIDGTNVSTLKQKKLSEFRNKNIGFVFQFHHLLPEFTALENICMPAFIKGLSKKQAEAKAKELMEMLSIEDRATHKPGALSGGEQQRVSVARSLINNPKIVLADEPSGNLDTENSTALHTLFFELREKFNQTFIIVTHNEELAKISDRKIYMKDGKVFS